jgi:hypothetical protein
LKEGGELARDFGANCEVFRCLARAIFVIVCKAGGEVIFIEESGPCIVGPTVLEVEI